METKRSLKYLKAKKKVEALKSFYSHLVIYVVINVGVILMAANVFNAKAIDFSNWTNYITAAFWGIGLIWHGIYVFFVMHVKNNFLARWEEKKIKQVLEKDQH
ncbi:2TM domain-containing protein [Aequorivita marina]|uniref:2TM domain-containing protein n=1 Tax=Aequorivita marina TaxID=3073654 RepID=UPI0028771D98|nr:2TM domain-containing protein [Aequorivita sp. S2608]MDS1299641.1 2TM domain-containing protein [Aequorivita sp. S2608]